MNLLASARDAPTPRSRRPTQRRSTSCSRDAAEDGTIEYDLRSRSGGSCTTSSARLPRCTARTSAAIDEFRTRAEPRRAPTSGRRGVRNRRRDLAALLRRRQPPGRAELHQLVRARDVTSARRTLALSVLDRLATRDDERSWTDGTIYLLPRDDVPPTPESRELVSERAGASAGAAAGRRLTTSRSGSETRGHRRGESVRSVVWRNALRMPWTSLICALSSRRPSRVIQTR